MHLNRHIAANVNPNTAGIMKTEAGVERSKRGHGQWACKFTCRDEHQWTIKQHYALFKQPHFSVSLHRSISLPVSLSATHLGLINIIARVNASAFPLWRQLIKCGNNAAQHNTKTERERDWERKREKDTTYT